jgi:hypothetical protein
MKPIRTLFVAVLVLAVTAPANAQLGGLKKKLKEKAVEAGLEKATGESSSAAPAKKAWPQFKEDEVSHFSAKTFDGFIASWKKELEWNTLSSAEQDRRTKQHDDEVAAADAKIEKWKECLKTALTQDEEIEIAMKYQSEMQTAAEKAANTNNMTEYTKTQSAIIEKINKDKKVITDKRCGAEPKYEYRPWPPYADRSSWLMKERLQAFLAVRAEKGASAAYTLVLANPEEQKILEARAAEIEQLFAQEAKPRR